MLDVLRIEPGGFMKRVMGDVTMEQPLSVPIGRPRHGHRGERVHRFGHHASLLLDGVQRVDPHPAACQHGEVEAVEVHGVRADGGVHPAPVDRVAGCCFDRFGMRERLSIDGEDVAVRGINLVAPDVHHEHAVVRCGTQRIDDERASGRFALDVVGVDATDLCAIDVRPWRTGGERDGSRFARRDADAVLSGHRSCREPAKPQRGIGQRVPHRRGDDRPRLHAHQWRRDTRCPAFFA